MVPLQLLLTAASMVGCINAIVGGGPGLIAGSTVPGGRGHRHAGRTGLAALGFAYRVQRFRRAAAMVPQLYESQSPDMPGWTQRAEGRGA